MSQKQGTIFLSDRNKEVGMVNKLTCSGEGRMKAELTSEDEAERSDSDLLVTTIIHDLVKGTTGIALLNINVRLCLINV